MTAATAAQAPASHPGDFQVGYLDTLRALAAGQQDAAPHDPAAHSDAYNYGRASAVDDFPYLHKTYAKASA